ncbi:MAG: hypothetical protein AAF696_39660, partial [Bacteroidota bacterium]
MRQFEEFLLETLKRRGDVFTENFLTQKVGEQTMFSRMLEDGRFFLILDSFDEIPQVLDENEASWLIDKLSSVIYRFLAGGNQSRGVLASRIFRRPSENFDARTVLEVRPFTEAQIFSSLQARSAYDKAMIKKIFAERPDLVPALRNPFTTGLVPLFAKNFPDRLPANQSELYLNYLDQRFVECKDRIERISRKRPRPLTVKKILQGAQDISRILFDHFGLEASTEELVDVLTQNYNYEIRDAQDIIRILTFAKISRKGFGLDEQFSFVHRRFAEYFVAQSLPNQFESIPVSSIPKDKKWREALVLYCEVTDELTAQKIAQYCWEQIQGIEDYGSHMDDPKCLDGIHSLRFLNAAYRNRLGCLAPFRESLGYSIKNIIQKRKSLLLTNLATEAVGLLSQRDLEVAIIEALKYDNDWISQTALRACRHLPTIGITVVRRFRSYLGNLSYIEFMSRRKELLLSFSLSDGLNALYRDTRFRALDYQLFRVGLIIY